MLQKNEDLKDYMKVRNNIYQVFLPTQVENAMISEANWMVRAHFPSGEAIGIRVQAGDICYLDYGQSYRNEAGFQHFGLCMAVSEKKALFIPMTSNPNTYAKAFNGNENHIGKKNLYDIGEIAGLKRKSVLFLNDCKFVNTARVIRVQGHLNVKSKMFHEIQLALLSLIFGG